VPLLAGQDPATISENVRRLRHEGYPGTQAAAIAYRKAREETGQSGMHDVTIPRRDASGRSRFDVQHARGLALHMQSRDYAKAQHHARELARLRGQPDAWPVLYEAAANASGASDGAALVPLNYAGEGFASTSGAGSSLAAFYDAHPRTMNTVVATATLLGGLRLNAKYPEGVQVGPVHFQASTWAGLATLGLALGARAYKMRRTTRVAASATFGFGLATGATRLAGGAAPSGSGPRA
jgi:hypothetical protein